MKAVISTVVVGIVLFLLGWLIYGILLADLYKEYFAHLSRSESEMKIWAFAVAGFAQALFLYLIYAKGYQGGSPVMEGFRFGVLISLFSAVPYVFYTWGGMPVKWQGAAIDGVICVVELMIASILTAIIHGKKEVKTV